MKLNPMFKPPADFVKTKPHRKLYIPTDEYPGYNFIGKCTAAVGVCCCCWSWIGYVVAIASAVVHIYIFPVTSV